MSKNIESLMSELKGDLRVLQTQYDSFQKSTDKKLDSLITKIDEYQERLSIVESKQLVLDSKSNALAIFQMIFSTALSAVAAFLGGGKKI